MDFYAILEVPRTASSEDIKRAYKRLALMNHPDKNPGDSVAANEQFKKIVQAYAVLGDEKKRQAYNKRCDMEARRRSSGNRGRIFRVGGVQRQGTTAALNSFTTTYRSNPNSVHEQTMTFSERTDRRDCATGRVMVVDTQLNGKKLTTKHISEIGKETVLHYEDGVLVYKFVNGVPQELNER